MDNSKFPADHKRIKKKLIAPMNHLLQDKGWKVNYQLVSHEHVVIPEIFWITYLDEKLGHYQTSKIMSALIKECNEIHKNEVGRITGLASSFLRLSDDNKKSLINRLSDLDLLITINEHLSPIKHLFPDFPLNFLIPIPKYYEIGSMEQLKKILSSLNDRLSSQTTFTIAHLIYPLLEMNFITINPTIPLHKPEELLDYPSSEKSQRMAATLRNMAKMVDRDILTTDSYSWQKNFWKQCFKLEPCKI